MNNRLWIAQKERGASPGMRIMLFILNTFGYAAASLFLYPIVFYFYLTGKKARTASLKYLSRVHHTSGAGQRPGFFHGLKHFIAFAGSAMDRLWFWQSKLNRFKIHTTGLEEIQKYLDEGYGCLLLGAHLGNFDALRALSVEKNKKVNAVMYLENAKRFNHLLQSINPDSQLNIINLKDRSIEGVMALQSAIKNGELVAMLADRFHPSSRSRVVMARFLGEDAPFPANPWLVANLLQCPTFFVAGVKVGRRTYQPAVQFVAEKVSISRANRDRDLKEYIAKYAAFLEQLCCQYPYQWFNFYDFWRLDDSPKDTDN
ncbi:MAG: hypothetical protein JXR76_13355 [Deltaproteobacteria bacterium]|nr:hypothetical protein [Deltaproteobacteria bacterium]